MKVFKYIFLVVFIMMGCSRNLSNQKINFKNWNTSSRSSFSQKTITLKGVSLTNSKIYIKNLIDVRNEYLEKVIDSVSKQNKKIKFLKVVETYSRSGRYNAIIKINNSDKVIGLESIDERLKIDSKNLESNRFESLYSYICDEEEKDYSNVKQLDFIEIFSEFKLDDTLIINKICSSLTVSG